jgi:2-polyprenyl-6-methoxyphenol hydroxylase-like FAD-dependent oxidoreductase
MGLTPAVLKRNTGETATTFLDPDGNFKASIPAGPNSPTSDLEILRGDLGKILYDETKDETEWIFNDHIAAIHERQDGVSVEFASGKNREFGLVIIADGAGSRTRNLAFGKDGYRFKALSLC